MKSQFWLAAAVCTLSVFAAPHAEALTSDSFREEPKPEILSAKEQQEFRSIYAAIKGQNWENATSLIAKADKGPMADMAQAELYLAAGSPRVEAVDLEKLLNRAPWLPQAARLKALAEKRGAASLPELPGTNRFSYLGEAPRRQLPQPVDVAGADAIRSEINLYIRNDQPSQAETSLNSKLGQLSTEARTEMQQRVAWSYYIENDDRNAQRLGEAAMAGSGEWATLGAWAHAMASWRLKEFDKAYVAFDRVARSASNDDMRAAGLYWSARSAMATKQPQDVQKRLQSAAQLPETFYGILASEALGMEPIAAKQLRATRPNWNKLKREENISVAVGLSQIGEDDLADESLKYQARIGRSDQHGEIANLAGMLNLPATQLWLGHYGPSRDQADALSRYPMPSWQPTRGWRVDPALAFAHTLQESQFRTGVVSAANAVGLMQVRPGTAGDIARSKGISFNSNDLKDPRINLEYGQSYLEYLRDSSFTNGLLPKVIAAYNAGPAPVSRWNDEVRDGGDPLLYIESIPYWETRGYLTIILRNYWIYEMRSGKNGGSATALAQYLWPKFPGGDGRSSAVRANGSLSVGN